MGLFQGSYRTLGDARAVDVVILDQFGVPLSGFDHSRPANAAITAVPSSAVSVVLLAANPARREFYIQNKSGKILFIAFGATATTALYTATLAKDGVFPGHLNGYTGVISGIWSGTDGNGAVVTEVTT